MRNDLRRALRALLLPTIALVVVAAFLPGRLETGVRVYALLVCAATLAVALAGLRRSFPPIGGTLRRKRRADRRPEPARSLAQLQNITLLGVADARDLHFRLRPRVRLIAAGLLESRHGIALDEEPARARALLGEETWELVRGDRPVPADERGPGTSRAALERVVVSLERL